MNTPIPVVRCPWSMNSDLETRYHDEEWGRPVQHDAAWFETLSLEGFQAGLSWLTILRKRESFRHAFAGFDLQRVAAFAEADVQRLLQDPGIVRHRGKITAVIGNAGLALRLREEFGSLGAFFARYADLSRRPLASAGPMEPSARAIELSRELRRRGFGFVGPTTVYAFMQATGLVNDHLHDCHVHAAAEADRQVLRHALALPRGR